MVAAVIARTLFPSWAQYVVLDSKQFNFHNIVIGVSFDDLKKKPEHNLNQKL